MNCNNTFCLWNYNSQCCPESEVLMSNATPNKLDCPSSLRIDFQEQLINLVNECSELLQKRTMSELIEIKRFTESQRTGV